MKLKHTFLVSLSLLVASLPASPQAGIIQGTITDLDTKQPLPGANVILNGTNMGAATDYNGHFEILNIPVGSYSIQVHMIGYKSQARANVRALANRSTTVNLSLEPTILSGNNIVVTAGYFERVKDAATSVRSVDFEEIRSDPVGAYDILSMMQSLPSVVSGADQSNEIIVRGGAPGENLFVMDHLDIPYPVHYPQQGSGGGPITMVNTDFIERIDFFAGSFPARYGDKLSSVMDVTVRDGNRDSHESKLSFDMAGFGASLEGPLNQNSSYLVSVKRSFLDFIIQQSGLMAIPKYWTFQGKVTYDLSPQEKLMVNYLGGIDGIEIVGEDTPQSRGAENVEYHSQQHTLGLTYKNLFSSQGYLLASLAQNYVKMDIDAYRVVQDGKHDFFYDGVSIEKETILKADLVYKFSPKIELSGGIKLTQAPNTWDFLWHSDSVFLYHYAHDLNDIPQAISTEEFYADYFEDTTAIIVPIGPVNVVESVDSLFTETYRSSGVHLQFRIKPTARAEFTLGGRLEYNAFLNKSNFSPRLNLSYQFQSKLKVNVAAGRYYQAPFYATLIQGGPDTDELDFYHADQIALGLEYLPREDVRVTVELYQKRFADMPIQEVIVDTLNQSDALGDYRNIGAGRSKGLELFIQKKFSHNWYGTFSYSHSISEGIDPRKTETLYYPWDYDYRDVVSLISGYKIRYMDYTWYNQYKETLFARLTSWFPLAPADEFEISMRFRYTGGKPITPKIYDHNFRRWYTYPQQDWNTERLDAYYRFDLMILQRFYFEEVNLVAFWDIMNVFNRDNPWDYVYNEDGTKDMALQYKTFPVGGITLEF